MMIFELEFFTIFRTAWPLTRCKKNDCIFLRSQTIICLTYFWFWTNFTLLSIFFRMIRLLACNQSKNDTCLNRPFWVSALSPVNHGRLVFPLADSSHCLLPLRFGRSGKTSGRSKRFIQVIYRFNKVLYKYLQVLPGFYPGFYHGW